MTEVLDRPLIEDEARIRDLLAQGLEYDTHYSVEDVLSEVAAMRATLWVRDNSVAVTNIIDCPQGRRFNIWVAAGDMQELIAEMYPEFEKQAREFGCKTVTITGRRGWVRAMKDVGFKEVATVVAKEL